MSKYSKFDEERFNFLCMYLLGTNMGRCTPMWQALHDELGNDPRDLHLSSLQSPVLSSWPFVFMVHAMATSRGPNMHPEPSAHPAPLNPRAGRGTCS